MIISQNDKKDEFRIFKLYRKYKNITVVKYAKFSDLCFRFIQKSVFVQTLFLFKRKLFAKHYLNQI